MKHFYEILPGESNNEPIMLIGVIGRTRTASHGMLGQRVSFPTQRNTPPLTRALTGVYGLIIGYAANCVGKLVVD